MVSRVIGTILSNDRNTVRDTAQSHLRSQTVRHTSRTDETHDPSAVTGLHGPMKLQLSLFIA